MVVNLRIFLSCPSSGSNFLEQNRERPFHYVWFTVTV